MSSVLAWHARWLEVVVVSDNMCGYLLQFHWDSEFSGKIG